MCIVLTNVLEIINKMKIPIFIYFYNLKEKYRKIGYLTSLSYKQS